MIVKFVKTGKTEEFDDSYGVRLIEQGRAVLAEPEPFMNKPEPETEIPEETAKPKSGKNRKGD